MTEPRAPAPDLTARARALDATTSFIVQAPAGSGKTTLLTQRYLTLLARVPRPEAVIAITFTRKAAAEMRGRVLDALARAAAGAPPKDPADATTLACAARALAHAESLGWRVVEQPARLRIQTIDSLCQWLAERLPILSRAGASLAIEPRSAPLYRLAAERTLARLDEDGAVGAALGVVLGHLGNEAERLVQLLADMLAARDRWLRVVVGGAREADLRTVLEESLADLVSTALRRVLERVPAELGGTLIPLARGAAQRLPEGEPALPALAAAPPWPWPDAVGMLETWRQLTVLLLTRGRHPTFRKRLTRKEGFPADADKKPLKEAFSAHLEALGAVPGLEAALAEVAVLPAARLADGDWQVVAALNETLLAGAVELGAVFAERGVVDFQAVAHAALEALGSAEEPTDLTLALDGRIEHLLVDEFQDTSAAQVALLERLTAGWANGDGRTLFLVGDPMQSIYGFREANVGLFLRIRDAGLGEVRLESLALEANFRSRPELVEWFNTTFASVLPAEDAPEFGAVRYAPSLATRAARGTAAVELAVLADASLDDEAARVVEIVRRERARAPDASIAVLGRSRAHLGAVATALEAAGLRYQGVDLVPLAARAAVQDLIALTRALLHGGDRVAWLACLRAPWCGLELGDLERLAEDAARTLPEVLADEGCVARLGADAQARLARTRSVLLAAHAARGRRPLAAAVEAAWLALGGPATLGAASDLADVQAFLARLDELAPDGDLDDPPALETALADLYAAPDPTAPETLQLLTVHKAKGLEWDVVVLPGLGRGVRGDARRLLEWFEFARSDGRPGVVLAPHLGLARTRDPLEEWLRAFGLRRGALELGRLLYVACTRARESLHLICAVRHDADGEVATPGSRSLLGALWAGVGEDVRAAAPAPVPPPPPTEPGPPMLRLARLPAGWTLPPAAPPVVPLPPPAPLVGPNEFEFEWVTSVARHVGTVVHEELEWLARSGPVAAAALAGRAALWGRRLAELGVGSAQAAGAIGRVRRALESTLADPRGAWILDPAHAHAASELELSRLVGGRVQSARIDRTFVDAAGVRWIVDFKTSEHEGTDLKAFLDRERERYRGQLELYAALMADFDPGRPVRLGLYFALHAGWREWPAGSPPDG